MTPATGHVRSVAEIATALKTQLLATKLADEVTAAFQQVELFDSENLTEAFALLLVSKQRIAIVVPLTAHWETDSQVRKILTRRVQPVALLISDRVIGNRTKALYGGGTDVGAYGLAARALPYVTGQLIANPAGVVSTPSSETVIILKKEDKQNLPGRATVALEIECRGGWIEAPVGIGPTL